MSIERSNIWTFDVTRGGEGLHLFDSLGSLLYDSLSDPILMPELVEIDWSFDITRDLDWSFDVEKDGDNNWILNGGIWNDSGEWVDAAKWID